VIVNFSYNIYSNANDDGAIIVLNTLNKFDNISMDKMGSVIIEDNVYVGIGLFYAKIIFLV
jgi:hypothetical protein